VKKCFMEVATFTAHGVRWRHGLSVPPPFVLPVPPASAYCCGVGGRWIGGMTELVANLFPPAAPKANAPYPEMLWFAPGAMFSELIPCATGGSLPDRQDCILPPPPPPRLRLPPLPVWSVPVAALSRRAAFHFSPAAAVRRRRCLPPATRQVAPPRGAHALSPRRYATGSTPAMISKRCSLRGATRHASARVAGVRYTIITRAHAAQRAACSVHNRNVTMLFSCLCSCRRRACATMLPASPPPATVPCLPDLYSRSCWSLPRVIRLFVA